MPLQCRTKESVSHVQVHYHSLFLPMRRVIFNRNFRSLATDCAKNSKQNNSSVKLLRSRGLAIFVVTAKRSDADKEWNSGSSFPIVIHCTTAGRNYTGKESQTALSSLLSAKQPKYSSRIAGYCQFITPIVIGMRNERGKGLGAPKDLSVIPRKSSREESGGLLLPHHQRNEGLKATAAPPNIWNVLPGEVSIQILLRFPRCAKVMGTGWAWSRPAETARHGHIGCCCLQSFLDHLKLLKTRRLSWTYRLPSLSPPSAICEPPEQVVGTVPPLCWGALFRPSSSAETGDEGESVRARGYCAPHTETFSRNQSEGTTNRLALSYSTWARTLLLSVPATSPRTPLHEDNLIRHQVDRRQVSRVDCLLPNILHYRAEKYFLFLRPSMVLWLTTHKKKYKSEIFRGRFNCRFPPLRDHWIEDVLKRKSRAPVTASRMVTVRDHRPEPSIANIRRIRFLSQTVSLLSLKSLGKDRHSWHGWTISWERIDTIVPLRKTSEKVAQEPLVLLYKTLVVMNSTRLLFFTPDGSSAAAITRSNNNSTFPFFKENFRLSRSLWLHLICISLDIAMAFYSHMISEKDTVITNLVSSLVNRTATGSNIFGS